MVLPVRFQLEMHAQQTTTRELSDDGCFVRCTELPRVGAQVGLRLYLPGLAQAAEFVAVVREVEQPKDREGGFWADFVSSDPQARARLLDVLHPERKSAPQPLGSVIKRSQAHHPAEPVPHRQVQHPPAQRPPPAEAAQGEQNSDVILAGDPINRRAFPRFRARFAVRFATVQDFVLEYAANISAGGVFVLTDHPPEMNSFITVVMELPGGGDPVTARAQVVHRVTPEQAAKGGQPAGVGVQFVDTDEAFRARLDQAIEAILKKERK
jgi:uncharacterized protein (TIGR02266 family)